LSWNLFLFMFYCLCKYTWSSLIYCCFSYWSMIILHFLFILFFLWGNTGLRLPWNYISFLEVFPPWVLPPLGPLFHRSIGFFNTLGHNVIYHPFLWQGGIKGNATIFFLILLHLLMILLQYSSLQVIYLDFYLCIFCKALLFWSLMVRVN